MAANLAILRETQETPLEMYIRVYVEQLQVGFSKFFLIFMLNLMLSVQLCAVIPKYTETCAGDPYSDTQLFHRLMSSTLK